MEKTIDKFLLELENIDVNDDIVSKVENKYNCIISNEVKKVLSINIDGFYFKEDNWCRMLSLDEIINGNEEFNMNFIELDIFPVIDIYDNDFICYSYKEDIWVKVNIADEMIFSRYRTIKDILDDNRM